MSRVYRSMESRTGVSWSQISFVLGGLVIVALFAMAVSLASFSSRITPGTTDWKGDRVASHYDDWQP